ncbi:unnamed protein product [Chondrus crispus]|uniref:Histidine kinase/HSP90-like ATPase domain-containing protein n=1 Tax=Chondrus crispus TaxID=2769 RepID=R7Q3Y1_CHOCR|nr:unnamed protein product [Chondrus crispus]CDF33242.1 unnamed protein product [Chondrus crispus]|eukprot:XP_005713045.1 unnamed protein product [Chondrus crispus]
MSAFVPATPVAAQAPVLLRRSAFACPASTTRLHAAVSRRCRLAPAPRMMAEASAETEAPPAEEKFEFQAEVSRVMHLIINSLYSNKDIFLRELVSNASDACDKKRFLALSSGTDGGQPEVFVKADKEKGTITVEDSGIGMTRQELINNLGSIATSGTSKFVDALGENGSGDMNLIGQFGVGFYSAYLVSDSVQVVTRSYTDPNAKQYRWESDAENSFIIREDDSEPFKNGSGTRIILHVKEGCKEFLENYKLEELMKRYSEFIQFPVYSWASRTEYDEVPDGDEKDAEGKQKMKREPRTVEEWSQVNKLKPLWMRKPKEISSDEYSAFYKTITKDFSDPLAHTHFAVEGDVEFRALLFCPKTLPSNLRQNMFGDQGSLLKLYVKRVFISDKFEDLLPRWLVFIKGVIDSEDLPLNVSREILQKSRVLRIISKRLVRKSVDMFKAVKARDNNDFEDFWAQFGRYIKAGIIETDDHTDDLMKLALWPSTQSQEKLTDLDGYVSRMKESQKDIYFVAADSRAAGESAPAMERLRKHGYEVLFLTEPVDEMTVQKVITFKTKRNADDKDDTMFKFVDVTKDDLDLGELKSDEEKKEDKALVEEYKAVVEYFQKLLSDKVGKVQVSDRLTESASTITQSSFGISPTMERYMKEVGSANLNDPGMSGFMVKSRTLEINPKHPIVKDIKTQMEGAAGGDEDQLKQTCTLVYELALLTAGYPLDDTAVFARRVSSLVSPNIAAPEVVVPDPEQAAPSLNDEMADLTQEDMQRNLNEQLEKMGANVDVLTDQARGDTETIDAETIDTESIDTESIDTEAKATEVAESGDGEGQGEEKVKKAETEVVE